VLVGLSGISLATDPERRDQAGRLLDLLVDGLRPRPPAGPDPAPPAGGQAGG
jgi:hypothetical protein